MKKFLHLRNTGHRRRGGAVIVVVLSLLSTLVFLGLFFFNWTSQELANAEYYADPDVIYSSEVDYNTIFDQAAEQLIVGTRADYRYSALGAKESGETVSVHSMLAHAVGRIIHTTRGLEVDPSLPGTGAGIVTQYTSSEGDNWLPPLTVGKPSANTNNFRYIYAADSTQFADPDNHYSVDNVPFNFSRLAYNRDDNPGGADDPDFDVLRFRPSGDYTYPDHNNLFLAYDEKVLAGGNTYRILIPSFFRPQLLPELRSSGSFNGLYSDGDYGTQVFRPHQSHGYRVGMSNYPRYLTAASTPAQSGDTTRTINAFPFLSDGRLGIFTDPNNAGEEYAFLDVDTDGDGVKDAIWIDLDLPMLTMRNGNQYVPLASFKVEDADALINLNAHGNQQGVLQLQRNENSNEPISVSNLGMSRSEVNPLWSLFGDAESIPAAERSTKLRHLIDRFGISTPPGELQLSNMEWFLLLNGWNPQSQSLQTVVGRHGDEDALRNLGYGGAGRFEYDDNENQNFGARFAHPLAPTGLGLRGFQDGTSLTGYLFNPLTGNDGAKRLLGELDTAQSPLRWPMYKNFGRMNSERYPATLVQVEGDYDINTHLRDEDAETILEPGNVMYGEYDTPFPSSENAALQLNRNDFQRLSVNSRVRTLAAANFQHVSNADDIRRRFTTDSWDRLEFNYSMPFARKWETEAAASVSPEFPPVPFSGPDPFRPEIRDLLRNRYTIDLDHPERAYGSSRTQARHRLNLNGILSNDINVGGEGAFQNGSPLYRNLKPHPTATFAATSLLENANFHNPTTIPDFNDSDPESQEWWARYDRQRLARDIYCLLWVLGKPEGTLTEEQLQTMARETAQFAVNMVDALDPDNVITRFEYDPMIYREDSGNPDRYIGRWNPTEVVYGIEQQQLVFSEWLLIQTQHEDNDTDHTYHKDDREVSGQGIGHSFLYFELRNTSPLPLSLADQTWRIVKYTGVEGSETPGPSVRFDAADRSIPAGGTFVVACHDGNVLNQRNENYGSAIYVDVDGGLKPVVPLVEVPDDHIVTHVQTELPTPLFDLDLSHPHHEMYRHFEGGDSLVDHVVGSAPGAAFTLSLQRRQSLGAGGHSENEWIEVDRIRVSPAEFNGGVPLSLGATPSAETVRDRYDELKSQEREHPFTRAAGTNPWSNGDTGAPLVKHSLRERGHPQQHVANDLWRGTLTIDNKPFPYWQPHFDRDFSSVMELLSIPLFGTLNPADTNQTYQRYRNGGVVPNLVVNGKMSGVRTAQVRFSNPAVSYPEDHPFRDGDPEDEEAETPVIIGLPHYQNRWYRLLEFVDVKSLDQLSGDAVTAVHRRTPGKVNLNTLRHESVLAGLIDDPHHLNPIEKWETSGLMTDDKLDGGRNWYQEHRFLRDGIDPFLAGSAELGSRPFIPGGYRSQPFRSLSHLQETVISNPDLSIEQTILRHRPDSEAQGLYEAATSGNVGSFDVDYHTKNRILAKIANNSTTRSHVFFVWMRLDFFSAHRNPSIDDRIQIGAKSEEMPSYRMFCVVDMSRLEEAYNPVTGTFDFRKFIIHRQLLP